MNLNCRFCNKKLEKAQTSMWNIFYCCFDCKLWRRFANEESDEGLVVDDILIYKDFQYNKIKIYHIFIGSINDEFYSYQVGKQINVDWANKEFFDLPLIDIRS